MVVVKPRGKEALLLTLWGGESLEDLFSRFLSRLPERELSVLSLYYGLEGPPLSYRQIGEQLHLSAERVRQIKEKALFRLRSPKILWKALPSPPPSSVAIEVPLPLTRGDKEEEGQSILQMPVEELDLSVRLANCLEAAGVVTLGDLVKLSPKDLLRYRNFGHHTLQEIEDILHQLGLSLSTIPLPHQPDRTIAKLEEKLRRERWFRNEAEKKARTLEEKNIKLHRECQDMEKSQGVSAKIALQALSLNNTLLSLWENREAGRLEEKKFSEAMIICASFCQSLHKELPSEPHELPNPSG